MNNKALENLIVGNLQEIIALRTTSDNEDLQICANWALLGWLRCRGLGVSNAARKANWAQSDVKLCAEGWGAEMTAPANKIIKLIDALVALGV